MNKQQLASKIWESANKMRSKIEANEYKDYILGFIFYKFLSENELMRLKDTDFTEDDLLLLTEDNPDIVEGVQDECGSRTRAVFPGGTMEEQGDSRAVLQ